MTEYRKEIDGLRAIAVLSVMLFHAGIPGFSGGFLGVDVFFVISGFLITSIVLKEVRQGNFSLARFYERRARRILPAYTFVVLCTIPLAWQLMLAPQLKNYFEVLLSSMFFVSNIFLWTQTGYFQEDAERNPLLHTWSLGVEEQFYLLFPLLMMVVLRGKAETRFVVMILILSLISLSLSEIFSRISPDANFFLLPFRFWELGVGVVCAFFMSRKKISGSSLFSFLGLMMICTSIACFDAGDRLPSSLTLIPVLGTGLFLLYGSRETVTGKLLSIPVLSFVGLISFSAYLWHQPVFAFHRLYQPGTETTEMMASLTLLSIGLAFLTYRYVENPFRYGRSGLLRKRSTVLVVSAGFIVFPAIFAGVGIANEGFPDRLSHQVRAISQGELDRSPFFGCVQRKICRVGGEGKKHGFVLGDSHATSLTGALSDLAVQYGVSFDVMTVFGCGPMLLTFNHCGELSQAIYRHVIESEPDFVVLSARWPLYFHNAPFDNHEGGVENNVTLVSDKVITVDVEEFQLRTLEAMRHVIELYLGAGIDVVLVWSIPEIGWDVPSHLFSLFRKKGYLDREDGSVALSVYKDRTEAVHELFRSIDASDHGGRLVHVMPEKYLCDPSTGRCLVHERHSPFYFDDDHLTNLGAMKIAPAIMDAIVGEAAE